ncbi:biotin--acetyl-CoA-carboxylase ligase [Thermogladius calderae 1633]|uniref:Biotin--acetyl-CoA-carboxylase ligase n=1 Tax=Thermogladius calderae (strain DSM 22663 / VKM B-2946 / 1633) TaxID=1184251 RepID=I3TG66_THEC1|nr:biotin--[acetyl-CoA-carboxylase] ligase [Thermogladius calderae]AFK51754.1 biotin--acetyl-CoA-carboxylase ligase [Thermogladius calderae 1633]
MSEQPGIAELLLLDLLSARRSVGLNELSGELGLEGEEVLRLVEKLSRNYIIRLEGGKVSWFNGDNPRAFKPWGWMLQYKVVTGSTMTAARHLNPWSIVVAEYQLAGRGRFGKSWVSSLGGLWVTYKLRVSPRAASISSLAVPLYVIESLEKVSNNTFNVKWPNDITFKGRKVSGVLLEAESIGEDIVLYVGVGINVNNDPPLPTAESLKNVTGELVPRNKVLSVLTSLISRIEHYARRPETIMHKYTSRLETLGRRVEAETEEGTVEGVVEDVDEQGRLVLKTYRGEVRLEPYRARNVRYVD